MGTEITYKRNCANCGAETTTKNKYWHLKSIKENRKCTKCALIGRIFTQEHKLKLKQNHANFNGQLNPFKGKSHKKESIHKMLDTRSNHPTWKQNASASMKKIQKEYWTGKNPMDNLDSVKKIRLARIEEIKSKNQNQTSPNYNQNSIPILENKAKEIGITDLQHAENGGEYYIKELGYWVDGYSKEKNVVIEYYEKHHNRQLQKDLKRESEIKQFLKCEFIIIRE